MASLKARSSLARESFFTGLVILSFASLGLMVTFLNSQKRVTTKSGAAPVTNVTLRSLDQIPGLAQEIGIGGTFTVLIPALLYKQIYIGGADIFCRRVGWCTGPFDAKFVANQNIWSSGNYILQSGARVPLTANYYFYASNNMAKITLSACTVDNRACTVTAKSRIQGLLDRASAAAFNFYYQYVDILAISNDPYYLTIIFRVKAVPYPTSAPITSTPTPLCADTTPPFPPGRIVRTGENPYNFIWGVSGCIDNPKKYFFRRYNGSKPSGTEPDCPISDTTSGSCWRMNTSISNISIDFNNSTCAYFGTDKGCYVYVWAKDASNNISSPAFDIIYQP